MHDGARFFGTVVLSVSGTAHAHEFIVKPAALTVGPGTELQVAALSSHVFLISQELEAAKDVKVGFYADGKRSDIPSSRTTEHLLMMAL
jgi:hypothetical protein